MSRASAVRLLAIGSVVSLLLLAYRATHPVGYGWALAWNLLLAWIPFLLALAMRWYDEHRTRTVALLMLGLLWLLFLPNAPYILTDFKYVDGLGAWYDAIMTAAFAGTGLMLGLGSLYLVQRLVVRRLGRLAGMLMLPPVFVLSSAGVVLGRVYRLNSWDALTRPGATIAHLGTAVDNTSDDAVVLAAFFGLILFLTVAYFLLTLGIGTVGRHSRAATRG